MLFLVKFPLLDCGDYVMSISFLLLWFSGFLIPLQNACLLVTDVNIFSFVLECIVPPFYFHTQTWY